MHQSSALKQLKKLVTISGTPSFIFGKRDRFVDALVWLAANKNTSAIASNHFGSSSRAKRFISALGRNKCIVRVSTSRMWTEPWRIEREGGPYTDTLFVTLPLAHYEETKAALNLIRRHHPNSMEQRGNLLTLWWD